MTKQQLLKIAPISKINIDKYWPFLDELMPKYGIVGKQREAAFIAQVLHESLRFIYAEEIASGAKYEGRKDLGNVVPGDGIKFKGRGLIQVTGRANYERVGKALGVKFTNSPKLLSTPRYAVESACWFWKAAGLNEIADNPEDWNISVKVGSEIKKYGKLEFITRKINGGVNGLADREKYYLAAMKVL